jgi:iron(III) transport system substrate-binding protein
MDLADTGWKAATARFAPRRGFQAIVSALLQLKGEAATATWPAKMKENATPYRGNTTAMKAVNAGEIEGAVIYH